MKAVKLLALLLYFHNKRKILLDLCSKRLKCYSKTVFLNKSEESNMSKYVVKLNEEDLQMIKDCHSKNPSIMKAMNEAEKVED